MSKLKGLITLIGEVVEHGSKAVEQVHLDTSKRTFDVLEQVPGVEQPARIVHAVHDASVTAVYISVRAVSEVVVGILGGLVDDK